MPVAPVSLPSVAESFQVAMTGILKPLFSSGNSQNWNNQIVNMYDCELIWDLKNLYEPRSKMMIAFIGSRSSGGRNEKCIDPLDQRKFAYERREDLFRTVYVGVAKSVSKLAQPPYALPNKYAPAELRDCDRVWSQLAWAFKHELQTFTEAGIYAPNIPFVPAEFPLMDYWMMTGQFSCQIRFKYTIGN